jgi:hypothetical protein
VTTFHLALPEPIASLVRAAHGSGYETGYDDARASYSAPHPVADTVTVTIPEAARLASMTTRALRHMRQRGLLPLDVWIARGGRVFVHREKFMRAIVKGTRGRVTSTPRTLEEVKSLGGGGDRSDVVVDRAIAPDSKGGAIQ